MKTRINENEDKLWRAGCDLGDGAFFASADHADRDQALARAVMSAVCLQLAYGEGTDE